MIIYINGYWNRFTGLFGISPGTPAESYWIHFSPDFISSSNEFMGVVADEAKYFIDGSSLFGFDQLAGDRYLNGSRYVLKHYSELTGSLKPGEAFKIISHSEGCAFAAGVAAFLMSYGCVIEKMLYLSPREGDVFINPHDAFAIQVHYCNDPICFPKRISGIAVFINLLKLDDKKASLIYAHGGTVKESTIKKVKKILKMLPKDFNSSMIEGHWTITETIKGYDFKREVDLIS
jgi:hypothetical protein